MVDSVNICRANGCRSSVPARHLMCRFHWSLVTVETRKRLLIVARISMQSQAFHEALHDARNEVDEYLAARASGWR